MDEQNKPVFVGRKQQLERLGEIYQQVESGSGATLFIFGEGGSGKGVLMDWFIKDKDAVYISYVHKGLERRPYTCFIGILKDMEAKGCISPDLTKAAAMIAPGVSTGNKETLFRTMKEALTSCAAKPLAITIKELHWADRESIELFTYLSREVKERPILLSGTYAMSELGDRDGKTHPLVEAMGEMMMEGLFSTIEVGAMPIEETGELISHMVGSPAIPAFISNLHSASKGNPTLISDIINKLIGDGTINKEDPNWSEHLDLDNIVLPGSVQDVLMEKVNDLGREEKELLELISVFGVAFNMNIATNVLVKEESEVFDMLLPLIEKRLVDEVDGHYTLHHFFLAKTILGSLTDVRQQELHRIAAIALSEERGDDLLIGHHAMEAKEYKMAAEHLIAATQQALNRFAIQTALDTTEMALECALKVGDQDLVSWAKLYKGKALTEKGEWNEGFPRFEEASLAGGEIAAEAFIEMGNIERNRSEWDRALDYYNNALETIPENTIRQADLYRGIGKIDWRKGDYDKAEGHLQKAIAIATDLEEHGMLGSFKIDIANIYNVIGKGEEAITAYQDAIDVLSEIGGWAEVARAYNNMGEVYKDGGSLDKAIPCYLKTIETAENIGDKRHRAYGSSNVAECFARMGRVEDANKYLSQSIPYFEEIGEKYMQNAQNLTKGLIATAEEKWDEAIEYYEKGTAALEEMEIKYDMLVVILEHGKTLVKKGDLDDAKRVFEKGLAIAKEVDARSMIAQLEEHLREIEERP